MRKLDAPAHGRVRGDVWRKAARGSLHMLRAPQAWALDMADLDAARRMGVHLVHVHDLEALAHHWASLQTIEARGFDLDRGYGLQRGLALEDWRPTRAAAVRLARDLAAREPEPAGVQTSLWQGGGR